MPISQISPANSIRPVQAVSPVNTSRPGLQPTSALRPDTVKVSIAAQVKLMRHQGISPGAIASQLGLSVKQLANYIPAGPATTPASQAALAGTTHPVDADDASSQTGTSATSTTSGPKALAASSPATEGASLPSKSTAAANGSPQVAVIATRSAGSAAVSE